MNHGWRWGKGVLQQGDSKTPRALQGPARCTRRLAGASAHTEQQGTNRTAGQQDSILPQPPAQTVCTPNSLSEKQLPRLLCELKGRKPALPGQTGDDIVASLSCKFLNTTSCQGPLPTAPGLRADYLEPGWECQAWAQSPAQLWLAAPAMPARRSAWPPQEIRSLAFQFAGSSVPLGNACEGSSPIVLSHYCPGLGASYEEKLENVVQPHESLTVPAMLQSWVGYLQSSGNTNTISPAQHPPPKPSLHPPSHTTSPRLHNSLRAP